MWEDYCPPNQQTLLGESSQGWGSTTIPTEASIVRTEDPKLCEVQLIFEDSAISLYSDMAPDRDVYDHSFPSHNLELKLLFWTKD